VLQKLNDHRIRSAIAGGVGGLVGWTLGEILVQSWAGDLASIFLGGALYGITFGVALGVAGDLFMPSAYRVSKGAKIGARVGLIAGVVGDFSASVAFGVLRSFPFIGRSIGWAIFGAFIGIAVGFTRGSSSRLRSGALGGLIGGAIGGLAFDLVDQIVWLRIGNGVLQRAAGFTILGACIGLWIVVMERQGSFGILKITSGQYEGRELFLDKSSLTLGSDERGDMPVYGDPEIRSHHATLRQTGTGYVIEANAGAVVLVNSQPVSRQSLVNEDELLIGSTRLIYRDKSSATTRAVSEPATPEPAWSPRPAPPLPVFPAAVPQAVAPTAIGALWLVDARTGQRCGLQAGVTTIGRAPDNNIVLDDATVSGYHAEIHYQSGQCVLHDKNSRNGTFVNGRRISGANLIKLGWRITIGDVELILES